MKQGARSAIIVVSALGVVAGCASRHALGRTRPDLAAWVSADDGLFGFAETYSTGTVGPFRVGDTRAATVRRLANIRILQDDQPTLRKKSPSWRLAIPAKSGGYVIYTLRFENERVVSVKPYYSAFAGL